MRFSIKTLMLGALLVPLATSQATAQTWKWDWNINAGYSVFNKMLDADVTGVANADGKAVKFKNGGLLGTQLTFWPSSRIGIRANGTYADRPLEAGDLTMTTAPNSGLSHVNLWGLTGDLMFRFVRPAAEFTKMEFLPYLALGVGAKWHNPSGDAYMCNDLEEGKQFSCAPFTAGSGTNTGNTFALAEANSLMGLVGLGADWRISRSIAIRTEIGDRIWDARLHHVAGPAAGNTFNLGPAGDADFGDDVNELYAQVGLGFLFGVARPAAVAIVEPAPVAPPPAAPTVRRESISVCVIDPTAPGGIRLQTATLIESRDTVITVEGVDRPFASSVGNVMVASNADWYVKGQPLTITIGNQKMEFATYGSARVVEHSDLAFLGTVNGVPVYADRGDVAEVIEEINELNRAQAGQDLGKILANQKELREEIDDIKVLYVPMHATGCVFQGVQRQEEVRKGGK